MLSGNYTDLFLNSSTPDLLGFITAPIKEILSPGVFYIWVIGLTMSMLYLKGQNTAMIGIIGLLLGVAFLPALPQDMYAMGIILLTIAIAAIIWRAFKSYE